MMPSLSCLRIGAQRLCLALMLALLLVPGYVVVPLLFSSLESPGLAGGIAGRLFHLSNTVILFLAVAVAAFWWRRPLPRWRWLLLSLLLLLVAVNEFAVGAVLADIKTATGGIAALARDHPERIRFGMWHGISSGLHLLETLIAALLVALGAVAKEDGCTR